MKNKFCYVVYIKFKSPNEFYLNSIHLSLKSARKTVIQEILNFMNDDVGYPIKEVYDIINRNNFKKAQKSWNEKFPGMTFHISKRKVRE